MLSEAPQLSRPIATKKAWGLELSRAFVGCRASGEASKATFWYLRGNQNYQPLLIH